MSFIPRPQEIYKHFKGNLYQITAVAQHTETDELLVVYQALYGDFKTYARPLEMFLSEVDREKYPNAEQKYRFELQGGDTKRQKERESSVQEVSRLTEAAKPTMTESSVAAQSTEAAQPTVKEPTAEVQPTEGELKLDPLVLEFLDADSYEQRLNILAGLHHRITDDMINTMAIAVDVEVEEGDIEQRYEDLKNCLLLYDKFECNRMR